MLLHQQRVGNAHIAEMPGLRRNAGQGALICAVTLDEAITGGGFAETAANAVIGEMRADEVDRLRSFRQIDGKAGLMLAAAGLCYIACCEIGAFFVQRIVPDLLLLGVAAPAGNRHDAPGTADGLDAGGQHFCGLCFQQNIRVAGVRRGQRKGETAPQRVLPVDKHQRPQARCGKIRHMPGLINNMDLWHHTSCTPSSTMRVSSV